MDSIKFELWDHESTVLNQRGEELPPEEVYNRYYMPRNGGVVLEKSGDVMVGIHNLAVLQSNFGLDPSTPIDDQLEHIRLTNLRQSDPDYDVVEHMLNILDGEEE